jgi:glycosyltransferase involved in cell wall biosynthesis
LVYYHNDIEVINVTSDIGQKQKWYYNYHENGYGVICVPSFDIVHHFPCYKIWSPWFWKVLKYIKKEQPDIIQTHTRFFLSTLLWGILAKLWWIKRVHIEHGSWFVTWIARWKKIFAWIYDQIFWRFVFRYCDTVVSINKANIEFVSKFTLPKKITVIYNGIQLPEMPNIIRKDTENIHLMFIGRLTPLKWISLLIKACHQLLKKDIKNRKLDIVWDGEMKESLRHEIQHSWLSEYISLVWKKSHDEVVVLLQQTDVVVNPSYQEWLPTSVLEGLLSKCVVVATNVGGTPEISDKKDLILVDKWSVFDLQKGLEYAIQNYEKLRWLSYELVKERFDWQRSVEKYCEVYKKFII